MSAEAIPITLIAIALAGAGVYHILAPKHSEELLSRIMPVRIIGATLTVLGAWCLFSLSLVPYLVGVPTLLSGLARFFAPERMITVNTWTSRHFHGVLMLFGAVGCVLLLYI
jgi:hypothetical protein